MPVRVKYRIMSVLNVETDINTCITTDPMGRAMIQVTMLVNTFKTDFYCFYWEWHVLDRIRVNTLNNKLLIQ
jgi:hypothetical protein